MSKRICVFCGSSAGARPAFAAAAMSLAQHLARNRIGIVYGGGNVGLMGALADAALAAGGDVIGVIPHSLALKELAHRGVADLRVVGSMHERKALMAELSDAFIAARRIRNFRRILRGPHLDAAWIASQTLWTFERRGLFRSSVDLLRSCRRRAVRQAGPSPDGNRRQRSCVADSSHPRVQPSFHR